MLITFPPFEPDKASFNPKVTGTALNVIPIADGWAPYPQLVPFADALEGPPRGTITVRSSTGTQVTVVGTVDKLFTVASTGALTDVSGDTYALPDGDDWSFTVYGDRIIATNLTDGPQYFDIGSSTDFDALAGSPPAARFVTSIGDFVILWQLANRPTGITWSGINNSEQWTAGSELSDSQDFPDGEALQAIIPNGLGATLLFRTGARTMSFVGGGLAFTFSPFMAGKGCAAPRSAIPIGRGDFLYYSDEGFYRGAQAQPIGHERVDRWFAETVRDADRRAIVGVSDPFRKVVMWRYAPASAGGAVIGYHYGLDRWFLLSPNVSGIGLYAASSITLEELDALYDSIDDIPFSLDSDAFAGGYASIAGFDASYRLGFFQGEPMSATIETNAYEFNQGFFSVLDEIRPMTDGTAFTVQVGTKAHYSATTTWGPELSPSPRNLAVHARSNARMHAVRLKYPAGASWSTATGFDASPRRGAKL